MKNWLFYVLVLLLAAGCEKAVDFNLNDNEPKLVVEANIENSQAPFVVLSQSLNYFSTLDPQLTQPLLEIENLIFQPGT